MRFAWTDDQLAFRDAVAELLAKDCTPAVVRAAWDAPAGALDRGVWHGLVEMGVTGVLVPEAAGGLGLDECFLAPVLEQAGRAALPHPLAESALVGAPLGVEGMVATDLGGPLVPCAADADVLLLADPKGKSLHRAPPSAVTLTAVETVDRSRRAATVRWSAADDGVELLTDDPAVVALAFDRGVLGAAASLVGLARTMLELTVAYVAERRQFGAPVGSFQAVKHHLADALLGIEFAAPAVAHAAWVLAQGDAVTAVERARDVSLAKALAADAARTTGRAALQCHGAIGYTVEHDLHLYLKRAEALRAAWGDRAFHADRVADALSI